MDAEAKKYFAYARECARQTNEAASVERRDKLLELAKVWLVAALTEGNIAVPKTKSSGAMPKGSARKRPTAATQVRPS